ncbi:hypothetical protein [Lyngbya aestuarii]|uniref:hypothetical protein n=1 Tax=Lyngbya aestuarii TaxID=118322 RepID=UPI00403DEC84
MPRLIDEWRSRKVNALIAMITELRKKGGKTRLLVQDGAPTEIPDEGSPEATSEPVAA